MKKAAFLLTAALACLGQVKSEEPAASQPASASAPSANLPDLLPDAVDPYQSGAERARFYKAAGSDSELAKDEFEAAGGKEGSFVREFDKWEAMLKYDKNSNGKIDWFEADAYRRALRASLLAKYDLNKDGQLSGEERAEANKALRGQTPDATGRRPSAMIASSSPGGADYENQMLRRYDADGDGKLSDDEIKAMQDDAKRRHEDELLARYDTNRDGRLDDQERKVMEDDRKEQARRWDETRQAFEQLKLTHFDRDGDGKLSEAENAELHELKKEFENVGKEIELAQFDLDGDGKITPEERQEVQRQWRGMAFKVMAKTIKYADTDGDGKASSDEMQALRQKVQQKMLAYLEDLAAKYDRNADGKLLDKGERQALLDGLHDEVIDRIKKFDADKDGRLSPSETINLMEDFAREIGIEPAAAAASRPAGHNPEK